MRQPSIAIFGAGAIGIYLASRFAAAGIKASLITRPGKTLPAPLIVEDDQGRRSAPAIVQVPTDQPAPHDIVIVTVKAHQFAAALPEIRSWLAARGELVVAQNGLPWWYFQGLAGAHEGRSLQAADPDGRLLQGIDLRRTIACIIHKSVDRPEPGRILAFSAAGDRFIFGRPLGGLDPALQRLLDTFHLSGLPAAASADIRSDLWDKLLGNVVLNPLSASTGRDLAALLDDPETHARITAGMQEARAVAESFGISPGRAIAERLERSAAIARRGRFRTSMLQDRQAGKPLELEPIVGAVIELARLNAIATPTLDRLYAEARAISP